MSKMSQLSASGPSQVDYDDVRCELDHVKEGASIFINLVKSYLKDAGYIATPTGEVFSNNGTQYSVTKPGEKNVLTWSPPWSDFDEEEKSALVTLVVALNLYKGAQPVKNHVSQEEFAENDGGICPVCRSENVSWLDETFEICMDCQAKWRYLRKIIGYEDLTLDRRNDK